MQTDWFKTRMAHLKVTQDQVGDALHLDRTVVSRILNGRQPLKLHEVHILADILDVPALEVLYRADFWGTGRPPMIRQAALINEVEAGGFAEAPPDSPPISARGIFVEYPRDTIFALRVIGDSMNQIAGEGSLLVIDYGLRDLTDGDLGVFRLDGGATFKRYRQRGSEAWLQPESTNPRHAPIFPDGPVEVVGLVVDIRPEHGEAQRSTALALASAPTARNRHVKPSAPSPKASPKARKKAGKPST